MDAEGVTIKASDVLKKYQDEFCKEVDAKFNLLELNRKEVIPDSLVTKIENADDGTAREILFKHLYCHADVATLREYCRIAISKDGYPKMQALGKKMLHDLPPEGPHTPVVRPIIPYIRSEYVEVKREFVKVCTAQGMPTLDEVKEYCIDLIEGALADMPRISRHEEDIEKAETMNKLASVVCFKLSNWVSYDFFKAVITCFQPALKSVDERLKLYEDQLKPLLVQKLQHIAELQQRESVPMTMAELIVKYRLDADRLVVKDLIAERDFLAQQLGIPKELLQVLSWGQSSVLITYWMVRDLLPLAELALCREDVRAELTRHGVEEIYLSSHPSEHPRLVDQSLQTPHLQRCAIVTVLDAHRQELEVTSLTSDLKDMGVLTAEQCQKVVSLNDKKRRHEALLYTLLASERPDTFHKLVGCMELRDGSMAAELQATFKGLVYPSDAPSVISSSQCTPESPEERAGSQVVEAMGGEVPPQQTEQAEPSRGGVQPHLEEESFAGELSQDDGVGHPQLEEGASGKGALELELAEAREAKERSEGEVRRLKEELERNVAEQAVAKERLKKDIRQLQAELDRKLAQLGESEERHRLTEDEFEHFKAEHADCDVSKKKKKARRRTERPSWWRRLLGRPSTTQQLDSPRELESRMRSDSPSPRPLGSPSPLKLDMDMRLFSDMDMPMASPMASMDMRLFSDMDMPMASPMASMPSFLWAPEEPEVTEDPEEPEVTKD